MINSLAVLGAGNLGSAIIDGILKNEQTVADRIFATNTAALLKPLREKGIKTGTNNLEAVENAEIILLTLKPHIVLNVLKEIKPVLNPGKHIIISVAAGVSIEMLQEAVGFKMPIFRVMPNTAAAVNESITCISELNATERDIAAVKEIFDHIGETIFIDEAMMNAATVLGSSGIAYVFRFIRAMIVSGIEIGFDAKTASKIVLQTVKGAAELLSKNGLHPEVEIDKVTTPKGCTITGLSEMEHNGLSSAVIKGIVASYKKLN